MKNLALTFVASLFLFTSLFAQGTMLLRNPAVSDAHIVFNHADDLWVVDRSGGEARRLTTAMGSELNPRISPFIDGGRMVAPRGGFFDTDGEWAVEGVGVAPDIEVFQQPSEVLKGNDPQLEAAVKEALRLLEQNPVELKPEPEAPVRWRRPERN